MMKIKHVFGAMLAAILVFGACQKDNLVTDVPHNQDPDFGWGKGDSIPIVSNFYFKGKIDSQLFVLQDTIGGYSNGTGDSIYIGCVAADPADTLAGFYGQTTGLYTDNGLQSLEIKFLKCISDSTDQTLKESLLFTGTYPYGDSYFLSTMDGVEITWVDATGKVWKSNPGSGAQYNHTFQVLNITPNHVDSTATLVITGLMDLELYNSTEFITIEEGEFVLQYGDY